MTASDRSSPRYNLLIFKVVRELIIITLTVRHIEFDRRLRIGANLSQPIATMRTAPFLTLLTFPVAFVVTSLAQLSPPTQGIQLGTSVYGVDIRFPLTVAQCETVLIYYSTIIARPSGWHMWIYPPHSPHNVINAVIVLTIPAAGSGYLEWVCDIPAGYGFIIDDAYHSRYYVVQSGTSSSCLRDITTIYTYAYYNTSLFPSYTLNSPDVISPTSLPDPTPITVSYPTGSFSTITANPDLFIPSTTSTSSVHSITNVTSPLPSRNPHTSATPAIAGSVVGGIAIVVIAVIVTVFYIQKRQNSPPDNNRHLPVTSEPVNLTTQTIPSTGGWINSGITPAVLPASGWEHRSDSSSPTSGHMLYVPEHVSTSSSTPISASMTRWPEPMVLPYNQSTSPIYESLNPSSPGTESWNTGPRMSFAGVQMPQMQQSSSPRASDNADMRAALDILARLDPAERRTLTSMLQNLSSQNSPH